MLKKIKEGELSSKLAEPALAEIGFFNQRLESLTKVWHLMAEPINYRDNAELFVPAMKFESQAPQFTDYLAQCLPELSIEKRQI